MLQSIHDRSQGWIVWIIFGFIILTFALWGVQSYVGVNEQPAVAEVDGVKITQTQYQRALQQQRERFQSMLGANYDPKFFDTPAVRRGIAENLIEDAVVKEFTVDSGMRVGERQIGQFIVGIPQFQKDGKFSEALFQTYLRSQGMSQDQLFSRLDNDILHTQLSQGISESAFGTLAEAKYESRLQNQKRDISYVKVDHKKYLSSIKLSDKEIEDYYKSNSQQFMTNEKVSVEYIDLSINALAKEMHVTDKELRDYYKQNKNQYVAQEQRRASHILIQVPKNADAAKVKKARDKAEDILQKIHKGASFSSMAKKYSQDTGSAKQGGDLGYFVPGTMSKAFDDKVFSMKKGQVSGPVRTEYGFHIIKLTDIKRDDKSFAQIKNQVARDYKKREADKQYYDLSEKLANIAYESPDSLNPAADQTGLKIQQTGLFERSDAKGILANPKVLKTVFSPDAISSRENEVVDTGSEHVVVLRVKDHVPAKVRPLEQVRSQITKILTESKAKAEAKSDAEKLLAQARKDSSLEYLAKQKHLIVKNSGLVTRHDAAKLDQQILNKAFVLPKSDKPVLGLVTLSSGDTAIVEVKKVVAGDTNASKDEQNAKQAGRKNGQLEYSEFVAYLKSQADITRHFDTLK